MARLEQRKGALKRIVTMDEFTLRVQESGAHPLKERALLYEELQLDRVVRKTTFDPPSLMATLLFAMIALAIGVATSAKAISWEGIMFWSLAALITGTWCWMRSGTFYLIPVIGHEVLALDAERPSEAEASAFIETLRQQTKEYAIAKFGPISGQGDREDQLNRLRWLRDRNYLSHQEFQERSAIVTMDTKAESGQIGFRG